MATVYKRGSTWWVRFQWNGQEVRRSARTASKSEARDFLAHLQAECRRLDRGGRPRTSFRDAVEAYIEEHFPTLGAETILSYQQSLRILIDEFGDLFLDDLTRARIAKFEAAQLRRVSPSKVKHYRAALSGVFNVAVRHDRIDVNPCRSLDPIRIDNARFRFLTPKEWRVLSAALAEPYRSVCEMSVLRGMRCGEILNLEWRDIDADQDTVTIRVAKGNTRRVIPLEGASAVLARQPRRGKLVFPSRKGGKRTVAMLTKHVNAVAREAGIEDFTFHDLRHTFASWYVQRGGDLYRLQRILGHTGPAMTQRYAHLRIDDLREVGTKTGTRH
jgi:integrase/recombinase XerD